MWLLSSAARNQLRQSHTAVSRVYVLHDGRPVYTLDVVSGLVSAEAGRPVLRNFSADLVDPTGALSGGDVDDLLSPYTCEVAPHRGVVVPGVGPEMVPLGVFGLTSRAVSGDGTVSVVGQDRAMIYQGPMSGALAISGNTPVEDAIARLLSTRNAGLQMRTWKTGYTVGPLLFPPDSDVWKEAQTLAESVGGYLYHDRTGLLAFGPGVSSSRVPVARYSVGDGLLLGVNRSEDSDTIHNVVVVESARAGTAGLLRAEVADNDPTSPTYAGGRYGRRVVTITNPHVGTMRQAQQAAATELVKELGRSETVDFEAVVDPSLDPLDVVIVNHPRSGLVDRGLVAGAVTTPLGVEESMKVGCRKSILATDGRVIEVPEEVTA